MPKEPTNKSSNRPVTSRTGELVSEIDAAMGGSWGAGRVSRLMSSRMVLTGLMIWSVFVIVVGVAAAWSRELPKVAVGRVMSETRSASAAFSFEDEAATEQARAVERAKAPRVYVEAAGVLEEIENDLKKLPRSLQGVTTVDAIEVGLKTRFPTLTAETLEALQRQLIEGEPSPAWTNKVARLTQQLALTPILDRETFQKEASGQNRRMELVREGKTVLEVPTGNAINAENPRVLDELRPMVEGSGFQGPLADLVVTRLVSPQIRPTYRFDNVATDAKQREAADQVKKKLVRFDAGEDIYKRGETLNDSHMTKLTHAIEAERRDQGFWGLWASRLSMLGVVSAVAAAIAGYTYLFVPRVRRNPMRTLGVAGLLAGTALLGLWASVTKPGLIALTGVAPSVFATVILVVAYNQRVALAYGCLHGILMCMALDQPVGMYAVIVTGIGVAVWRLKELRDREALANMGMVEAAALGIGTFLSSIIELPLSQDVLEQAGLDALLAGLGGLAVSAVTLFMLPTLERTFGLVTGMTLIELRDPKQPLLRQLQQRAPGTYNHSLNLATLAEAAADAIGADGLLTYIGSLYHDIGKMNKPDYFVENQVPGFNRHDRLTPAMSLLVIVGHVKDGLELAREFNLPRPLHHFIESHHGTTLVEYFFHRAKRQAEAAAARAGSGEDGEDAEVVAPNEIEYRYPGPRPRTKEAAIIMVCDAVESTARTMADPTPASIEAMVRKLANKRLMDGQFDECDLTLKELNTIVEAVSKTLASIYHGRIAYPGNAEVEAGDARSVSSGGNGTGTVSGSVGRGIGTGAKTAVFSGNAGDAGRKR